MRMIRVAVMSLLATLIVSPVQAQNLDDLIPLERDESIELSTPQPTPSTTPPPSPSPEELSPKAKARADLLKLPKSGILSSTAGALARGGAQKNWSDAKSDEAAPPISGSATLTPKGLVTKITNNSQEVLSISARALQRGKNGQVLKSDYVSAVLAPGKSLSRTFSKRSGVSATTLEMVSWKIVGK